MLENPLFSYATALPDENKIIDSLHTVDTTIARNDPR